CLNADEVYDAIDWRIIILLAGLLPLGVALSRSGAAEFIVAYSLGLGSHLGPLAVLAALYFMALALTEFMSTAAPAVILTSLGMSTANLLAVHASPFLIAIAFSASTSSASPVGYQTNA